MQQSEHNAVARRFALLLVLFAGCASPGRRGDSRSAVGPRAGDSALITVQLTLAEAVPARAAELFGAEDDSGCVVDPSFLQHMEDLARSGSGLEIGNRPRLVLLDGRRGEIQIGNEESYVADFRLDETRTVAEPVIATLWEGLRLELQPDLREDGEGIDVDFRIEISSVERPIPESTLTFPDLGGSATVQLPERTVRSTSRRVTLLPGQVFAFVLEPVEEPAGGARRTIVALTVISGSRRDRGISAPPEVIHVRG